MTHKVNNTGNVHMRICFSLYIDTYLFIYLLSFINLVDLGRTFSKFIVPPKIGCGRERTVHDYGGGFGGWSISISEEEVEVEGENLVIHYYLPPSDIKYYSSPLTHFIHPPPPLFSHPS